MKSKPLKPPRPVPVLTTAQEALLSAITESGQFTLDAVMARHTDAVRLRLMRDTLDAAASTMNLALEPKSAQKNTT